MVILITGGARSGKSLYAEGRALALPGVPHYIATAQAGDEEMAARIAAHRARRGPAWQVREAPLDLPGALETADEAGAVLVDCLTLWLANLIFAEMSVREEAVRLCAVARHLRAPVIFVTNEVGMGIVPENALARRFRDEAGWLNQQIAVLADEVQLVVSGYPLRVK
ncbi:MAG: bifunctional adenosylcobinamide kinase/adenosylcobinamide-phosphate guanylyltransferase [Rhodospirillales bacterium]|nr:bifunctional adenosylcobinamide kinase/adenosylcobinamide-phosphate guanylyltransferase [Rhodospirillales bacterium]